MNPLCASGGKNSADAGVAAGASGVKAYSDATQFDTQLPYFDAKSTRDAPRWLLMDVQALCKTRHLALAELRAMPSLADLLVRQKGGRLSITPVDVPRLRVISDWL